jgi:hypothetical protein
MSSEVETSLTISSLLWRQLSRLIDFQHRARYGRHYNLQFLFASNLDANIAHDHRNAHLQDQTRPASEILKNLQIKSPARA